MNTVNPASYNRVMLMVLEDTWSGPFVIRVIECYTLNIITGHFTSQQQLSASVRSGVGVLFNDLPDIEISKI